MLPPFHCVRWTRRGRAKFFPHELEVTHVTADRAAEAISVDRLQVHICIGDCLFRGDLGDSDCFEARVAEFAAVDSRSQKEAIRQKFDSFQASNGAPSLAHSSPRLFARNAKRRNESHSSDDDRVFLIQAQLHHKPLRVSGKILPGRVGEYQKGAKTGNPNRPENRGKAEFRETKR